MENVDKLIEKVKKLLALAGNNPNENEAAAAMERASRLMAQHNLTASQINTNDNDRIEDKTTETGGIKQKWARYIWNSTAKLNFTYYFYSHIPHFPDVHNLIGTRANVETTKIMAVYLIETVERLAYEAPIPGTQRTAFKLGAATRLAQRMEKLKRDREQGKEQTTSSNNLPALANLYQVHETDNKQFYLEKHGKVCGKGQRASTKNHNAFALGMQAANNISLATQIK
jgi:hypothetical protein